MRRGLIAVVLLLFGQSTLNMTYAYEKVNGKVVGNPVIPAEPVKP